MKPLPTKRMEAFARLLARGSISVPQAYVQAGYRPGKSKSKSNPYMLAYDPRVKQRIAELRAPDISESGDERQWIVRQLMRLAESAVDSAIPVDIDGRLAHQPAAVAVRLLELLGREAGMFGAAKNKEPERPLADKTTEELHDLLRQTAAELGFAVVPVGGGDQA